MMNRSKILIRKDIFLRNYRYLISERYADLLRFVAVCSFSLLLVGGTVLWWLSRFDVDEIQSSLVSLVEQRTGYQLNMGSLQWHWFEGSGLSLEDVTLHMQGEPNEVASIEHIRVRSSIWSMLWSRENLLADAQITGIEIKIKALPDGSYDWGADTAEDASPPLDNNRQQALNPAAAFLALNFDALTFENMLIDYQGLEHSHVFFLKHLRLLAMEDSTTTVALSAEGQMLIEDFPVIRFNVAGFAQPGIATVEPQDSESSISFKRVLSIGDGTTRTIVDTVPPVSGGGDSIRPSRKSYGLQIESGRLHIGEIDPYTITLDAKLVDGILAFNLDVLGNTKLSLIDMEIEDFFGNLRWTGKVNFSSNQLHELATSWGVQLPQPLQSLSLEGVLQGGNQQISAGNAQVSVNGQNFSGNLALASRDTTDIRLDLAGESFYLDPWVEWWEDQKALEAASASAGKSPALVSMATVSNYRWELLFRINVLNYLRATLRDTVFDSRSDGQRLFARLQSKQTAGGTLESQLALDFTPKQPTWQLRFDSQNVALGEISNWFALPLGIQGEGSIQGRASLFGNTREELLNSVQGELQLTANGGVLDSSGIRQQAMAVAVLTGDEFLVSQWPQQFNFDVLRATLKVGKGADTQRLEAQIDNLEIRAEGSINPWQRMLDFDSRFVIRGHPYTSGPGISRYLVDQEWPVVCWGLYEESLPCGLAPGATTALANSVLLNKRRPSRAEQKRNDRRTNNGQIGVFDPLR